MNSTVSMPKKIITLEIDTDQIFDALKSNNDVALKLTIISGGAKHDAESKFNLSSEEVEAMEKEIGWPF